MRLGTQIVSGFTVVVGEMGKVFEKNLGMGDWALPFPPTSSPTPLPFPSRLILGGGWNGMVLLWAGDRLFSRFWALRFV